MKLLVLCESLETTSGWGTYASRLVDSLRDLDVDVTVLTTDASSQGPRLPGVFAKRFFWLLAKLHIRIWLRSRAFDLVHVMVEPYAKLFPAFGSIPFVATIHGTYADPNAHGPKEWSVDGFRKALQRAKHLFAVSEFTRKVLPADVRGKTTVIWNGVDLGITNEPTDRVETLWHPLIFSVGAIKPRKGFDRLIKGFAVFARRYQDAELVIAGSISDEMLKLNLVSIAREHGVEERVRFLGQVARGELLGWYRACDVFALTPVTDGGFEGFGLVYLEANVFGKPAVGSSGSGAAEAIQDGVSGFLAEAENPSDIARALEQALSLPPEIILASLSGVSWADRSRLYLSIYQRSLGDT